MAGIRVYSDERLINDLLKLARTLGKSPTGSDVNVAHKSGKFACKETYVYRYGSYNKALLKAGLVPYLTWRKKSKEEILKDLIKLAKKLGRTPGETEINQASSHGKMVSLKSYQLRFGSLTNALKAAKLPLRRKFRSDEQLLKDLVALAKKLGRIPTTREVRVACVKGLCASPDVYRRKFGSHNKALRMAGMYSDRHAPSIKRMTKKRLIADLRKLAKKLGKIPGSRDINIASSKGICASVPTYVQHFGSINNAKKIAHLPLNKIRRPDEVLLRDLKRLYRKLGRIPVYSDIALESKNGNCAGLFTYYTHFGSLPNAIKLARIGSN